MRPLVSIIIPCYNAKRYVAEAIQSALRQTYPNCEIIVIDDGSTDGSLEVIKSFGDRICWKSGVNLGGSAARNRGLELARGDFIQFLDADDFIIGDKVARQVQALEAAQPGSLSTCAHYHCNASSEPELGPIYPTWRSYRQGIDLLVDAWNGKGSFPVHSWLIPRALIQKAGLWNERLSGDDDGEFSGRMLLAAGNVVFVEDAVAFYRRPGPGSVSKARRPKDIQSYFEAWDCLQSKILEKRSDHEAQLAVLRRLRSITYFYANQSPDWIEWAALRERNFPFLDWNFPVPRLSALLIAFFGLSIGLKLRKFALHLKASIAP